MGKDHLHKLQGMALEAFLWHIQFRPLQYTNSSRKSRSVLDRAKWLRTSVRGCEAGHRRY